MCVSLLWCIEAEDQWYGVCGGYADSDPDRDENRNPDANRDGYADSHGYGDVDAQSDTNAYEDGNAYANVDGDADCDPDSVMATVRARYAFQVATGPRLREFAQPFVPPEIALDGDPAEYIVSIPAASNAVLWDADAGGGLPTSFRFLLLDSDLEVEVEFTASGTAVSDALSTMDLQAGHIPFILGSDKARAGVMSDPFTTGTVGRITKIRGKNADATTAANVRVVIGA